MTPNDKHIAAQLATAVGNEKVNDSLWVLVVLANEFARVWTSFEVFVYRVLVNWSGAVVNCPGVRRVGGTCCTWGCRASRGLRGESVRLTRCHTPTRSNEGLHHPTPEQDICVKTAQRWPQKVQNSSQPKHWEVWNIEDECWIFGENIVALWGF